MEREIEAQLIYTVPKATDYHHEMEQVQTDECVMISNLKHFGKCCSQTAQSLRRDLPANGAGTGLIITRRWGFW